MVKRCNANADVAVVGGAAEAHGPAIATSAR
jgi:hypothetical protein